MEPVTTPEAQATPDPEARESERADAGEGAAGRVSQHYDLSYPQLSRWRRLQIPLIAWAVYWALRLIGPTLRFEVLGMRSIEQLHAAHRPVILAFWHRCIFTATWFWRARNIVVMNTTNFDGQWTRRVIERLGFLTAQGSSSRGGLKGLVTMARRLEEGLDVAFTIDGPRGPRFVAKPGPVMLARRKFNPILAFHIGLENAWTFEKTWDQFQIPKPFSRAVVIIAPPVAVLPGTDRHELERKHAEMQRALDRVRVVAEAWFGLLPEERDAQRQMFGSAAIEKG